MLKLVAAQDLAVVSQLHLHAALQGSFQVHIGIRGVLHGCCDRSATEGSWTPAVDDDLAASFSLVCALASGADPSRDSLRELGAV